MDGEEKETQIMPFEATKREKRKAIRGLEGQGHVQAASGEDRQLAGRVESRWEEIWLGPQRKARRHGGAAQGGGPQGRPSHRQILTISGKEMTHE
jgi:hypothetical protein